MEVTCIFNKKKAFLYHHFGVEPWCNYEVALQQFLVFHLSALQPWGDKKNGNSVHSRMPGIFQSVIALKQKKFAVRTT
jgi:hypothetical protein